MISSPLSPSFNDKQINKPHCWLLSSPSIMLLYRECVFKKNKKWTYRDGKEKNRVVPNTQCAFKPYRHTSSKHSDRTACNNPTTNISGLSSYHSVTPASWLTDPLDLNHEDVKHLLYPDRYTSSYFALPHNRWTSTRHLPLPENK